MGEIRLWNPATGNAEYTLERVYGNVRCLAFNPEGNILASGAELFGSPVSEIAHWDVKSKALLGKWNAHRRRIRALAYSPDGHWLVSGGEDGRIRIWQ